MSQEHRDKIAKSNILNRLIQFAEGDEKVKMTSTQVTAALGLLRKCLPDLQSVEMSGDPERPIVTTVERRIVKVDN